MVLQELLMDSSDIEREGCWLAESIGYSNAEPSIIEGFRNTVAVATNKK